MPRQRTNYFRETRDFPEDFRSVWSDSRRSRADVGRDRPANRHLSPHRMALEGGLGRPNAKHMMALLDLANSLGLGHLFTD